MKEFIFKRKRTIYTQTAFSSSFMIKCYLLNLLLFCRPSKKEKPNNIFYFLKNFNDVTGMSPTVNFQFQFDTFFKFCSFAVINFSKMVINNVVYG
jgi:hypothetical protein